MAGASSETNGYISRGNMTVILTAAGLVMAAFGAFIPLGNNATDRRITEVREDVRAIQQGYLKKDEHEEFKLRVDKDIARIERTEVPRSEVEANAARQRKLEAAAIFGVKVAPIPPLAPEDQGESFPAAIMRIGLGFDRPVTHHEIQAELRKTPHFAGMLDKNKGAYYYTVVNRLKKGTKIRKVGRKIRFIHKNNEAPPEETPEGAS